MLSIKNRLVVMNFLQFFVWGSWLITIGAYWFQTLPKLYPLFDKATHLSLWNNSAFGALFSTMGIASLFMPAIMGIIADKWINAEKLYGISHILGAAVLFSLPMVKDPTTMFWVLLFNMVFYMPTISLSIAVAYNALKKNGQNVVIELSTDKSLGNYWFYCGFMGS